MKKINLIGKKFNRLTVIGETKSHRYPCGRRTVLWLCRCDCGKETKVSSAHLNSGTIKSCGCLSREKFIERKTTHGDSQSSEYTIWMSMKTRCINPNCHAYEHYGGRGIKICDRWANSYEKFLADVGRKPSSNHSLDRIDNDGDYTPENCRWATSAEQAANTRRRRIEEFPTYKLVLELDKRFIGLGTL